MKKYDQKLELLLMNNKVSIHDVLQVANIDARNVIDKLNFLIEKRDNQKYLDRLLIKFYNSFIYMEEDVSQEEHEKHLNLEQEVINAYCKLIGAKIGEKFTYNNKLLYLNAVKVKIDLENHLAYIAKDVY